MPLLLWVGSAFSASFGYVVMDTAKKYAQLAAGIAAIIALAVTLKGVLDSAVASLFAFAPTGAIQFGFFFLSSNIIACISAIFTALIAASFYKFQRSFVLAKIGGG